MKRVSIIVAVAAQVLLIAAPAMGHVTVSPAESPEDGFATLTFQVPHGCEGSPTVGLAVQIPAGVVSVKPQVKPGWEIEIQEGTLPEPVDYFGETLTEGVLSVTWTGGPLEDQYMDTFAMSAKLPPGEGDTLFFPAVSTCEEGEDAWIQMPSDGETSDELEFPAPAVLLTAAAGGGHRDEAESTDSPAAEEAATDDGVEAVDDEAAAEDNSSSDPIAVAALVVGGLGLIAGGSALVMSRRNS